MMGLLPLAEAFAASIGITIIILLALDKCEKGESEDDESTDKTSER